jgi:hypothetical protein
MKVLVAGSYRHLEESRINIFKEACKGIGAALAKRDHDLILQSSAEYGADPYVLEGAMITGKKLNVVVVFPIDTEHERRANFDDKGNPEFLTYVVVLGKWTSARLNAVERADAVLLVGGSDGTEKTAIVSAGAKRPLLPIPCFGGAAKRLYEEPGFQFNMSNREKHLIVDKWDMIGSPDVVVSVLERVVEERKGTGTYKLSFTQKYFSNPIYKAGQYTAGLITVIWGLVIGVLGLLISPLIKEVVSTFIWPSIKPYICTWLSDTFIWTYIPASACG